MPKTSTKKSATKKIPAKQSAPQPIWRKKPVIIGSIFLAILTSLIIYRFYSDWSNKQLILGMSDDFPQLIAEIEQATGLNLEISSDCMQTTEKFTEGVKLCGVSSFTAIEEADKAPIRQVVIDSNNFSINKEFDIQEGFYMGYKQTECTVAFRSSNLNPRVVLTCLVAPRESNERLALEKLNAEYLNARKDFYRLSQ